MNLVTEPAELLRVLAEHRRAGRTIGFVPTLGALHDGHASLVRRAAAADDVVCVSVFLNPLQFDDPADLARYPSEIARDAALAGDAGASVLFAPSVDGMLGAPPSPVVVDPGPLGGILEGAVRPGHFRGVATIVAKLLALVAPRVAYFGEKDYQQLAVVRELVRGLSFPVEIVGCPTVRAPDGLALSSRNVRLDPESRRAAPTLYAALGEGRRALGRGASAAEAEAAMATVVAAEPRITLEYAVVRDAVTLDLPSADGPLRLLIAGRIGGVRLIDNLAGPPDPPGGVEYPSPVPETDTELPA